MVKRIAEINYIRGSCKIVAGVLSYIEKFIQPGITTNELDTLIEGYIRSKDAFPAFKGYRVNNNAFPASSCISVNEEVVHGIPGNRKLVEGDIVSIDVGVMKNGYYGDAAKTFAVGNVSNSNKKLLYVTEKSLYKGLEHIKNGSFVNDVSLAIQQFVESSGFSVVRELVGHGIGKNLHEEPPIPNYYYSGNRYKLKAGMTIAVEPMVNYGSCDVKLDDNKWTYITVDGQPSAHFEHSILVTEGDPEILTVE